MVAEIRVVGLSIIALFAFFLGNAAALAEIPVPRLEHRVTDLTGTLSTGQQTALENRLAAFERQKGSQIAVLIVPTTQPEDIAQYSIRVVEQWQLGRKGVDDGVLLLLAKNDRATRIEVGYGLEGAIPDALAKRIIEDIMIPRFREGDFAGGINAGVDSLIGLIQGEPLPEAEPAKTKLGERQYFPLLVFFAVISGSLLRLMLGRFLGGLANGVLIGLLVWLLVGGVLLAIALGFMAFVITQSNNRSYRGGWGGGGFGGGGGYSGGGFSGGGGGFGGGGASGRW